MDVYRSLEQLQLTTHTSCALGMFDGVHLGHQNVLNQTLLQAKAMNLRPIVYTFENHPQSILSQTPTSLLSDVNERLDIFEKMGFSAVVMPQFNKATQMMTAETFVSQILCSQLQIKAVTVGYDHRFGAHRQGDGLFLKQQGEQKAFQVTIVEPVEVDQQIVSSTLIRKLLSFGHPEKVTALLGHPYRISGVVVPGEQRGRVLGFPTANIVVSSERLVPASGVYLGWAVYQHKRYPAVCNIGTNPTFGLQTPLKIEVHLLNGVFELYHQTVCFEFLQHLRPEKAFDSIDALKTQITQDCQYAQDWFDHDATST
jgi:riboflavin kinase / FMN adenylyltransferase